MEKPDYTEVLKTFDDDILAGLADVAIDNPQYPAHQALLAEVLRRFKDKSNS